jgi:hypothetical protein
MIRDRKIELDTQLAIDTATIQKQEIDLKALDAQKQKLLAASKSQYVRDLDQYKQSIRLQTYTVPSEDYEYTITLSAKEFSINLWFEIFVQTAGGIAPLYSYQYYDQTVSTRVLLAEGSISIRFKAETLNPALGRHKIKAPSGLVMIVYTEAQ